MNIQKLMSELKLAYEENMRLSRLYFNKWIETGEDNYKEKELLHTGSAHAMSMIIESISKQ